MFIYDNLFLWYVLFFASILISIFDILLHDIHYKVVTSLQIAYLNLLKLRIHIKRKHQINWSNCIWTFVWIPWTMNCFGVEYIIYLYILSSAALKKHSFKDRLDMCWPSGSCTIDPWPRCHMLPSTPRHHVTVWYYSIIAKNTKKVLQFDLDFIFKTNVVRFGSVRFGSSCNSICYDLYLNCKDLFAHIAQCYSHCCCWIWLKMTFTVSRFVQNYSSNTLGSIWYCLIATCVQVCFQWSSPVQFRKNNNW